MYMDSHERNNVVKYWHGFISRWKEYEHQFHKWDNNGKLLLWPDGFPVLDGWFQLISVIHNESTFYQNNQRNTLWAHKSDKLTPNTSLNPNHHHATYILPTFLSTQETNFKPYSLPTMTPSAPCWAY